MRKIKTKLFQNYDPLDPLEHEGTAFQAHLYTQPAASTLHSRPVVFILQARCYSSTEYSNWKARPGRRPQLSSRVLTPHVPGLVRK